MGRKSKLKKERKFITEHPEARLKEVPQGDIDVMNHLGYGEHNRLRSPDVPCDRPEPQL